MFEVMISGNFSKLMTHAKSQIKEDQGTSSRIYIYIYMLKKRKNYTQANHTKTIVNKRQSLEGIHREKYEKQCNVENYKQTKLDFKS